MDLEISILAYLVFCGITLAAVYQQYRKYVTSRGQLNSSGKTLPRNKMTIFMIILITTLFTLYNIIVTKQNPLYGYDRRNYAANFNGIRRSPSLGLMFLIEIIRRFSQNVEILYYVCPLIAIFITLIAYRVSEETTPASLLFLLSTQYFVMTFAEMKQCFTNALACLCFAYALRNKGKGDTIKGIICIALAIWFHFTGYFLLPIFLFLHAKKSGRSIAIVFIVSILAVFFLEPLVTRTADLISPVLPFFSRKLLQYFGESASDRLHREGALTFLKGVPFYFITILGLLKRKYYASKIKNYDNYLFLSLLLSLSYVASYFSAWAYRMAYLFYFPSGIFFELLLKEMYYPRNKPILRCFVIGFCAFITVRFIVLMYVNYGGF